VPVDRFTLGHVLFVSLLVLGLGAVFAINLWELPAYLGLTLAALLLRSRLATGRWQIGRNVLGFVGVAGLAYLAYWPFHAHYKALYVGLGAVEAGSALGPFLTVWGFFLFILASYLIVALVESEGARWMMTAWRHRTRFARFRRLSRRLGDGPAPSLWLALIALAIGLVMGVGLEWIGEPVLALMVPLVVAAGVLLLRRQVSAGEQFTALLAFAGLGVVAGTEVMFLKDFLAGGEWYRMNTVFKFTTEAWVLIALASAMTLPTIWRGLRSVPTIHLAWVGVFGALLLSTLVYPIYGTAARVDDRFPGGRPVIGTLDGMAFMQVGEYRWPDDNVVELKYTYDALHWLLNNVQGTPVVAEANIGYYREGGLQVASYTGLPALIGFHQSEQRYDFQVGPRASKADALFRTSDVRQALDIIHELHVSYIYVGQLERAWYPAPAIRKFEDMRELGLLEVVYANPKVTIYHVTASEGPAVG
jgi:YYY domain-containing protein